MIVELHDKKYVMQLINIWKTNLNIMNLQKIINYINNFLKKTIFQIFKKKKRNKLILNKIEQTSFIKKRKSFIIKNNSLEKLKIFWNNITHYYLLICAILLSIIIYIIFWPIFKVKNIDIIKQDNITNMTIAYKAIENYRWQSIFNIDKKEILKNMQDYQQNISDIKTNIILPNTLKITINSRFK